MTGGLRLDAGVLLKLNVIELEHHLNELFWYRRKIMGNGSQREAAKRYAPFLGAVGLFSGLPKELQLEVLSHLSPHKLLEIRLVSWSFRACVDDNQLWNQFLKPEHRMPLDVPLAAKEEFLKTPSARAKYIGFGYLLSCQSFKNTIKNLIIC